MAFERDRFRKLIADTAGSDVVAITRSNLLAIEREFSRLDRAAAIGRADVSIPGPAEPMQRGREA